MKNIIKFAIVTMLFASCEKTLDLDYKSNQSNIVIEGNINDQAGPYLVKVSKSIALADIGSYPMINDAKVRIRDGAGNLENLIFIGNGNYQTTTLTGKEAEHYTLEVETGGIIYVAKTMMPQKVVFDGIKVEPVTFGGDTEYNIIPLFQDPESKGNNYRFVLFINGKLVNQHLVLNDEVINGRQNSQKLELNNDNLKLKSGDLVNIEMQCIDKTVSQYYTTLALMGASGPGGSTTPSNPPSNISGGALGVFSAHATQTKQVVIP